MPVTFEVGEGTLVLRVVGEWSIAVAEEARADAVDKLRGTSVTDILVDLRRAVLKASFIDIFEFTVGHAKAFPPGTRHAVILDPGSPSSADAKAAEDAAYNRGIRMRVFADEACARAWLDAPRGDDR